MSEDWYNTFLNRLSDADLAEIDKHLLARISARERKLSYLVLFAMEDSGNPHRLPDDFFAERLVELVKQYGLRYAGTLGSFRSCEIWRDDN